MCAACPWAFAKGAKSLGGGAANHPLKIVLERDKARIPIFDHDVQSFSVSPDKEPQPHPSHANQTSKRTNTPQPNRICGLNCSTETGQSLEAPSSSHDSGTSAAFCGKPSPRLNSRSSISIDRGLKPSYFPPLRPTITTILSSRASA
jgi:hypothetical protein